MPPLPLLLFFFFFSQKLWGYAKGEVMDTKDLLKVKYQGIRPAPGYPSQPDHTEKAFMWSLTDAARAIGTELTESQAMTPAASVSALCFWRKEAQYFAVGKLGKDQVEDYARRKGMSVAETERWLAPVLNYDPTSYGREAAE